MGSIDKFIVTIDGPAGAGKTTVGRRLALRIGAFFLETGVVYRFLAHLWESIGWEGDCFYKKPEEILDRVMIELNEKPLESWEVELGSEKLAQGASKIAKDPAVRRLASCLQRNFIENRERVVVSGRDAGSVVFPEARLKFFLTASLEERVRRRHKDLEYKGCVGPMLETFKGMQERDRQDSLRQEAPLKIPEGGIVIDTTSMSLEEVEELLYRRVQEVLSPR
jgi:cytidylate kinase